MAHLIREELHRIDLGDGEWVDVKRRLSYGDLAAMDAAAGPGVMGQGNIATGVALLGGVVRAWSFQEDGEPVPVTPENLDRLSPQTAGIILTEVNRLNPVRTEEERAPLSIASSATSGAPNRSARRAAQRQDAT
jgi:hypothetical protein